MAGNPTVIPGLFRADLSGLSKLAEGIGQLIYKDQRKFDEASEVLQDPVYAEKMARRLETAYAQDMADPNYARTAGDANARSAYSDALEAEMLGVRLDPTNPEHVRWAEPYISASRNALSAADRAQIGVGETAKAKKSLRKTAEQAVENVETVTSAEGYQAKITRDSLRMADWLGTAITNVKAEDLRAKTALLNQQVQNSLADTENYAALFQKYPALQQLMMTGGEEAVTQALLNAHKATLTIDGPGQLDPNDKMAIATYLAEMETEFITTLGAASAAETEQDAMTQLSIALVRYQQKQAWMGEYGPRSKFPVVPVMYEKSKWFQKSNAVRLAFGLAPVGVNVDVREWGDWRSNILEDYDQYGPDFVESELTTKIDPYWDMLDDEGKADFLQQLSVEGVFLPNLLKKYSQGSTISYKGSSAEKKSFKDIRTDEPLFAGKSAWSAGMEKLPDFLRAFVNWLPNDSAIQLMLKSEE